MAPHTYPSSPLPTSTLGLRLGLGCNSGKIELVQLVLSSSQLQCTWWPLSRLQQEASFADLCWTDWVAGPLRSDPEARELSCGLRGRRFGAEI